MKSLFYAFLVDCYRKRFADEEKLKSFVPKYISTEECKAIIETKD
ncbi:hypothetical protein PPOP_0762 [Paenibacillus popilliae ATCC 14706]|uniref:Uncharacterized protein n=1 Tax=Paenibacillus popilliae ATCC 14706 TaxID=1212764 RepID=M9L8C3_PAEPP|nr:hypothetical protein PPOP_0762 [Paenibacillus popilliae ATCC 14706]